MRLSAIALACALALTVGPAAAEPSASCKPVIDAMHKQWTTPNHVTIVQGSRPEPVEAIMIGDAAYMKMKNA